MNDKKLYIRIDAGEEGYYFTKDEGLRLLAEEYSRIEKENKQDDSEFAYEWNWEWLTEEEYKEFDEQVDKPRYQTPTPQSIEQEAEATGSYQKGEETGIPLSDLPAGSLFSYNGTIALKSEYRSEGGAIEAFIVGSGEMFWGGTKTAKDQKELMVIPIDVGADHVEAISNLYPGESVTFSKRVLLSRVHEAFLSGALRHPVPVPEKKLREEIENILYSVQNEAGNSHLFNEDLCTSVSDAILNLIHPVPVEGGGLSAIEMLDKHFKSYHNDQFIPKSGEPVKAALITMIEECLSQPSGDVKMFLDKIDPKKTDRTGRKWYEYYGTQVQGEGKESYVHSAACFLACCLAEEELYKEVMQALSSYQSSQPEPVVGEVGKAAEAYANNLYGKITDKSAPEVRHESAALVRGFIAGHNERELLVEGGADIIQNLLDAIPKQTEDADWWDSDLVNAVENAENWIKRNAPQPSSVIIEGIADELRKANPHHLAFDANVKDNHLLPYNVWNKCVSKLRELIKAKGGKV